MADVPKEMNGLDWALALGWICLSRAVFDLFRFDLILACVYLLLLLLLYFLEKYF